MSFICELMWQQSKRLLIRVVSVWFNHASYSHHSQFRAECCCYCCWWWCLELEQLSFGAFNFFFLQWHTHTHPHSLAHTYLFAVNKEALRLLSPETRPAPNSTWRARNDFDLDRRIEREKKHLWRGENVALQFTESLIIPKHTHTNTFKHKYTPKSTYCAQN